MLGPLDYARAALFNYIQGPLLQKLTMWNLPDADTIVGDSVRGLTAIVTGPTAGIGEATAAVLARRGAHVVLACRSRHKGEALAARLRADAAAAGLPPPQLEVASLDLDSLASVRAFVDAWEASGRPLHVLINNAGVFHMGVGRRTTADGHESHMGTNHLAHFKLTLGLLPALRRGAADARARAALGGARVVHVSSSMLLFGAGVGSGGEDGAEAKRYDAESAYGRSKLAQVLFARELRRRLAAEAGTGSGGAGDGGSAAPPPVQVYAVHPGYVLTDVVRSLPAPVIAAYRLLLGRILLTPEQGARASLYAAASPDAWGASLVSGGFFGADARPAVYTKAMQDDDAAARVWSWSAQKVKLPAAWDLPVASSSSGSSSGGGGGGGSGSSSPATNGGVVTRRQAKSSRL